MAFAGVLEFANGSLGSGLVTFNGGTLRWKDGNTQDISGRIDVYGASAKLDINGEVTFNSRLSGGCGLEKYGSGTLTLAVGYACSGAVQINAGTVRFVDNALFDSTVSLNGGNLDVSGPFVILGGLEGSGNLDIKNTQFVVGSNGANTCYSGSIGSTAGSGMLIKVGGGTLMLAGSNTYAGATVVEEGGIKVTGTLAYNDSDHVSMNAYTAAKITRRVLGTGMSSYVGLGATANSSDFLTRADIIAGTASGETDVGMSWRRREEAETTKLGGGLISDVLDLSGIHANGSGTDTFLLQMTYSTDELSRIWGLSESDAIAQHLLCLATSKGSKWGLAVDGNVGGTAL